MIYNFNKTKDNMKLKVKTGFDIQTKLNQDPRRKVVLLYSDYF